MSNFIKTQLGWVKFLHSAVAVVFFLQTLPSFADQIVSRQLTQTSNVIAARPILDGIKVYPGQPFKFNFLVRQDLNKGMNEQSSAVVSEERNEVSLEAEYLRLIKYFMASLTVPEGDLWVNLSPYEPDRIVPKALGQTEMGRDMLAQDYVLKQLTASLMNPEGEMGRMFWDKIYSQAYEKTGTTNVPIDSFNKVWIVPNKVEVYQHNDVAYITRADFKVMLESDYLAQKKAVIEQTDQNFTEQTKDVIRNVIIPAIEEEVNYGESFANLRQIFHSMILAKWYEQHFKKSVLGRSYVDQNAIGGIELDNKSAKQEIYEQYVRAFKEGASNLIKEEYDPMIQDIVTKKYFVGGIGLDKVEIHSSVPLGLVSLDDVFRDVSVDFLAKDSSGNNMAMMSGLFGLPIEQISVQQFSSFVDPEKTIIKDVIYAPILDRELAIIILEQSTLEGSAYKYVVLAPSQVSAYDVVGYMNVEYISSEVVRELSYESFDSVGSYIPRAISLLLKTRIREWRSIQLHDEQKRDWTLYVHQELDGSYRIVRLKDEHMRRFQELVVQNEVTGLVYDIDVNLTTIDRKVPEEVMEMILFQRQLDLPLIFVSGRSYKISDESKQKGQSDLMDFRVDFDNFLREKGIIGDQRNKILEFMYLSSGNGSAIFNAFAPSEPQWKKFDDWFVKKGIIFSQERDNKIKALLSEFHFRTHVVYEKRARDSSFVFEFPGVDIYEMDKLKGQLELYLSDNLINDFKVRRINQYVIVDYYNLDKSIVLDFLRDMHPEVMADEKSIIISSGDSGLSTGNDYTILNRRGGLSTHNFEKNSSEVIGLTLISQANYGYKSLLWALKQMTYRTKDGTKVYWFKNKANLIKEIKTKWNFLLIKSQWFWKHQVGVFEFEHNFSEPALAYNPSRIVRKIFDNFIILSGFREDINRSIPGIKRSDLKWADPMSWHYYALENILKQMIMVDPYHPEYVLLANAYPKAPYQLLLVTKKWTEHRINQSHLGAILSWMDLGLVCEFHKRVKFVNHIHIHMFLREHAPVANFVQYFKALFTGKDFELGHIEQYPTNMAIASSDPEEFANQVFIMNEMLEEQEFHFMQVFVKDFENNRYLAIYFIDNLADTSKVYFKFNPTGFIRTSQVFNTAEEIFDEVNRKYIPLESLLLIMQQYMDKQGFNKGGIDLNHLDMKISGQVRSMETLSDTPELHDPLRELVPRIMSIGEVHLGTFLEVQK